MIKLSFFNIDDLASRVVSEKGSGYVYDRSNGCRYVHENDGVKTPGCLVGQILHRAGLSLEDLARREGSSTMLINSLRRDGLLEIEKESDIFLAVAQRAQDKGVSWGTAIEIGYAAREAFMFISSE